MNLNEMISLSQRYMLAQSIAEEAVILKELRKKGQGILANDLVRIKVKKAKLVGPPPKAKGILSSLGGIIHSALGSIADSEFSTNKKNVEKIKSVMMQSLADIKNIKLTETARTIALKNFEQSRSVLEDISKNFPDGRIRKMAIDAALEVRKFGLNS